MKKMAQEIKNEPPASLPRNWLIFSLNSLTARFAFWSAVTWQKRGLLQNTRANFTKEDF